MASNFCRNCGFRLTPGKSFCANCGTMVSTPAPVQAPAPAAPIYAVPAAPVAAPMPQYMQAPVAYPVAPAAPVAAPAATPAPVQAVPAEPVATVAPAAEPEASAPASEPAVPVTPQPMQTVVTYHPEESVTEQLPSEAVRPLPAVPDAPAEEALEVSEAVSAPAVPAVPAMPAATPAASSVVPAAPVEMPRAPSPSEPKKKSHTGLVVGLICGAVALILVVSLFVMLFSRYIGKANDARLGRTVLDRIEVMDEVSSGKNYTVYDKNFEKKIEEIRWWDYDGAMKSQGVYYQDVKKVAFSIKVDEKTTEKLYYAFYYSKDENFTRDDLEKAEKSEMISPSYYKDGNAYYNIECDKSLKPGHYCVIVSKDKSFNKPYVVAYAKVLDETSKAE